MHACFTWLLSRGSIMLLSTSTFLMVRKERLISLFLDGYNWMEQQPISALSINSILLNLVRDTVIDFCTAEAVGDLNPDHVGEVGEGYRPRSNDVGGEATHGWQGRAGQGRQPSRRPRRRHVTSVLLWFPTPTPPHPTLPHARMCLLLVRRSTT